MTIYQPTPIRSNEYTLSTDPAHWGALVASQPTQPIAELRAQFQAQGYLWLKGLLNRADVLQFRRRFFSAMQGTGLLRPGTDPLDGLDSLADAHSQDVNRILMAVARSAAYEAFCLQPALWQFFEVLLDDVVYLHKRKIIRHIRAGSQSATGAHYDLVYLRGGTDSFCSAWIPIGDIPVEMGGLVYLEASDKFGRESEREFALKSQELTAEERINAYNKNMSRTGWLTKDLPSLVEKLGTRWLAADYEAGDIVIHSAYMIHAATNNTSPDTIRLSTDIRYQRLREEIDVRWNNHWTLDDML
jgi:ectoine hydroxylase-related dioxygenase (phytanoyl-CoA dioxygenase family)